MQFVHPSFLWALGLLAIPIIIHLFKFRRFKTVYFSNVAFLKQIQQESTNRNKLKHLLVLASRLLTMLFLILAFAQPYIPAKNKEANSGKKYVSLYVDNSFSMKAMGNKQSLLDEAKLSAKSIAGSYANDDLFQLLTNDFSGKQQRLVNKEELMLMLDEVEISPASRNWNEILKRQKDILSRDNSPNQIAYLISDFQQNMGGITPDSLVKYNLIPLAAKSQANLYIDSCFFYEPVQLLNQKNKLIVRVKNAGEEDAENIRLSLSINGQSKALSNPTVKAGDKVYDTIPFTISQIGWNKTEVKLEDFPITFDDSYFMAFNVMEKLNVLQIKEPGTGNFVDAVFNGQPEFNFSTLNAGNINYAALGKQHLIVLSNLKDMSTGLSEELKKYVNQGGSLLIFPNENATISSYNQFLNSSQIGRFEALQSDNTEVESINLNHKLVKDLFDKVPQNISLPSVKKYYRFVAGAAHPTEDIIRLKNKEMLLLSEVVDQGHIYICTAPLDNKVNEFVVHSTFAPLLYKMAINGAADEAQAHTIGSKDPITLETSTDKKESVLKIKGEKTEFIPEQSNIGSKVLLNPKDNIKTAGFYSVKADEGDEKFIALNYNRAESNMQFEDLDALKAKHPLLNVIGASGHEAAVLSKEVGRGTSLWKLALLFCLVFLAIEIGLLVFWKK